MRKIYTLFLLLIIVFSCDKNRNNPTDIKPKYSNFQNDWQEKNLFGKVKEIEWYKSTYQDDKKEGKAILNLKEKFTDFGNLKEISNFDNQGVLIQKNTHKYNNEKFNFKIINKNNQTNSTYIFIRKKDTINKTETRKIFVNDSLNEEVKSFFDENGRVFKQIKIEGNDTTITRNKYKLNNKDKIISETQVRENVDGPIFIEKYKYDEKGKLIKFSHKSFGTEHITKTEWKNGRISKRAHYFISQDLKKHLNEETEYDKLYNPIDSKIYEDSKLNRELKYQYEFDQNGNWIKRNVSMKQYFANSKEFIPIYNETRKIKYWK